MLCIISRENKIDGRQVDADLTSPKIAGDNGIPPSGWYESGALTDFICKDVIKIFWNSFTCNSKLGERACKHKRAVQSESKLCSLDFLSRPFNRQIKLFIYIRATYLNRDLSTNKTKWWSQTSSEGNENRMRKEHKVSVCLAKGWPDPLLLPDLV